MPRRRDLEEGDRAAAREAVESLTGIEDPALRRGALLARLAAMAPEAGAALLNGLMELAVDRHPAAAALAPLLADVRQVTAVLGQRRMAALLAAARDSGRHGVVRVLTTQIARRASDGPEAQPERTTMDHVPLGWRKQLGRTGSRDVLDRLVYDQQPSVIETLLANPRTTEREVVRIVAHRPTSAAILAVVFRHPRWIARYTVKRALALNPYTIPAQAIGLLPSLLSQDLELIADDETLHEDVSSAAGNLLAARRPDAERGPSADAASAVLQGGSVTAAEPQESPARPEPETPAVSSDGPTQGAFGQGAEDDD
jgi:hypothetical protein